MSADMVLFPELSLSGYSLDDLFMQSTLVDACAQAIADIVKASETIEPILIFGAPVRIEDALYNCAIVVKAGRPFGRCP